MLREDLANKPRNNLQAPPHTLTKRLDGMEAIIPHAKDILEGLMCLLLWARAALE